MALVPVWEVLTRAGYRVVDGLAVGSRGEVRSVAVFHDKPLEECGGISLTPHSMSSVQLWRVVSEGAWGLKLEEREDGEARLRIGDEALREWTERKGRGVTDLGKAWWDWVGKPFVFGVWAVRKGWEDTGGEVEKFREECLAGIAKRGELAVNEEEREYLTKCIRYELGVEEKEGIREFARRSGLGEVKLEYI
jgi:chorismate dehydratase